MTKEEAKKEAMEQKLQDTNKEQEVTNKVTAEAKAEEKVEAKAEEKVEAKTESAEESAEKTDAEKLADAQAEIEELKTKMLYKQAEFENFRKRVLVEKADLILNGGKKVLEAMLPVVDDLERALKNMDKAEDVEAVKEGVDLICKKFLNVLKAQGVTPIETEGADFNVDLHEAIAQIPAPTDELKGKVLDCTLKGYMINDKVLRYAQVAVAL